MIRIRVLTYSFNLDFKMSCPSTRNSESPWFIHLALDCLACFTTTVCPPCSDQKRHLIGQRGAMRCCFRADWG